MESLGSISASITSRRAPRPQNVPGEVFVDHTCIDCATCRWMAPSIFSRIHKQSAVYRQPSSANERLSTLQALISCPTASIHTVKPPADIKHVHDMFPLPIDEKTAEGIYHCGYHSEKSYGATPYLITRAGGNVLVDSPKFTSKLANKLELMGGVQYMFLTHKDDVADHKQWNQRFKCQRIIHKNDVEEDTMDVEIQLEGTGPWPLGEEFDIIFTPGHSEGGICLFYKTKQVLFTGDHLVSDLEGELSLLLEYNKDSAEKQVESLNDFIALDFIWILPGHRNRINYENVEAKNTALKAFIEKSRSNVGFV